MLSLSQKNQFDHDGFLIINQFISSEQCDVLIERAETLIDTFQPSIEKTIFSAKEQTHAKHQYFFESSDKIHFFFEENAFNSQGELNKDKALSINKIGHALHDLDPIFNSFSRQPSIECLVNQLISQPLLAQSMYICKQPFIGGEVTCHQDSTYLHVERQPVLGLWFALQDATLENGCLWSIPGGHLGPLKSRLILENRNQLTTQIYDHTAWDLTKMVPLEVERGSLILLHGQAPHMSKANTSSKSRHAYALHVISGDEHYSKDNWLQRSDENPFKGF